MHTDCLVSEFSATLEKGGREGSHKKRVLDKVREVLVNLVFQHDPRGLHDILLVDCVFVEENTLAIYM